jgi:hypothetical protein
MLASNQNRDPFNRPAGTGYFPHESRHFVPGYYQPVPPGRKALAYPGPRIKLALMGVPPYLFISEHGGTPRGQGIHRTTLMHEKGIFGSIYEKPGLAE